MLKYYDKFNTYIYGCAYMNTLVLVERLLQFWWSMSWIETHKKHTQHNTKQQ